MATSRRTTQRVAVFLLVVVAAIFVLWAKQSRDQLPEIAGIPDDGRSVYYTGPMKGKNGTAGLPDGSKVDLPSQELPKSKPNDPNELSEEEKEKT